MHLGWTGTRPNHPSLDGRELLRHIPKNNWLLGRHHWMPGRHLHPHLGTRWLVKRLGHSAVPGTGGPTSPWSCTASSLSAESSVCGWHFVGLCFWPSSPSHSWNSAARAGSVPHNTGPLRVLGIFRIRLRKMPWTGSPVALAKGESLQCCTPKNLSVSSDICFMFYTLSLSSHRTQVHPHWNFIQKKS